MLLIARISRSRIHIEIPKCAPLQLLISNHFVFHETQREQNIGAIRFSFALQRCEIDISFDEFVSY